jgi:ABC-2 type transport system permease protein/sodium transport system permease protein
MSPMVAGVVEEMAFRGYMQRHLERIGPTFAILVTSAVFTLLHATHGLTYLLTLGPGIFLASAVYGHLALKSGSILPGMALHFAGDLAFTYFAVLGGDSALLFAD